MSNIPSHATDYLKRTELAYQDWYIAQRQIETGIPGSEVALPSLERVKECFDEWAIQCREDLHSLICIQWDYPSKRKVSGFDDAVTVFVALSEWLLQQQGIDIPAPLCVAAILVRRGLDTFCSAQGDGCGRSMRS